MLSLDDLRARRGDILDAAARHGATNVRVFGSVARGEATDASDLDLLVEMAPNRSLLDRIALMHDLEDLLGRKIEVVNERALHPLLRDRVLAEGVRL
jgi:predicted nucleotidyltransferase